MTAIDPVALYERWLLELWQGDESVAQEILSEDFTVHQARWQPGESEAIRGPQASIELVRMGRAPFSPLTFMIEVGPIVDGDMLAARWNGHGAYAGGLPGATAPEGTEVAFGGIDIMRVADERFAGYWVSSDGIALMQQLGALG